MAQDNGFTQVLFVELYHPETICLAFFLHSRSLLPAMYPLSLLMSTRDTGLLPGLKCSLLLSISSHVGLYALSRTFNLLLTPLSHPLLHLRREMNMPRHFMAEVVAGHRIEARLGYIDPVSTEQECETIVSQYGSEKLLAEFNAVVRLRVSRNPVLWAYVRRELGRDLVLNRAGSRQMGSLD